MEHDPHVRRLMADDRRDRIREDYRLAQPLDRSPRPQLPTIGRLARRMRVWSSKRLTPSRL